MDLITVKSLSIVSEGQARKRVYTRKQQLQEINKCLGSRKKQ